MYAKDYLIIYHVWWRGGGRKQHEWWPKKAKLGRSLSVYYLIDKGGVYFQWDFSVLWLWYRAWILFLATGRAMYAVGGEMFWLSFTWCAWVGFFQSMNHELPLIGSQIKKKDCCPQVFHVLILSIGIISCFPGIS